MASVVVTLKIMPDSPDADLASIQQKAEHEIASFGGKVGRVDIVPVAFGLRAVNMLFVMDEKLGSTDALEAKIGSFGNVNSAEVTDVRRAIG